MENVSDLVEKLSSAGFEVRLFDSQLEEVEPTDLQSRGYIHVLRRFEQSARQAQAR